MSEGEIYRVSQADIAAAIKKIEEKSNLLSEKATAVSKAFTDTVQTVQLEWLNNMISEDWNGTGVHIVDKAKIELKDLITKLVEISAGADLISKG